jgi:hypothetical protein
VNCFTQHEKFNTGPLRRAAETGPMQKNLPTITNRCRGDAARRSLTPRSTSACASACQLSVFRRSSRRPALPDQPSAPRPWSRPPPAARQISAPRRGLSRTLVGSLVGRVGRRSRHRLIVRRHREISRRTGLRVLGHVGLSKRCAPPFEREQNTNNPLVDPAGIGATIHCNLGHSRPKPLGDSLNETR